MSPGITSKKKKRKEILSLRNIGLFEKTFHYSMIHLVRMKINLIIINTFYTYLRICSIYIHFF